MSCISMMDIEKEISHMYNRYIVTKKRSATDDNNDDNFDIDRSNHWKLTTSVIYSLCVWCCPNWAFYYYQLLFICFMQIQLLMNIVSVKCITN